MNTPADKIDYDVATALWQGARPYQEDALLADFHGGLNRGFAVLADGMGGHAAGDLASRLVVIDAASHLKFLMHDGEALERTLQAELRSAIQTANDVLKDRAADDRSLRGMGATFLATVLFEDRLYWASVGDSPLYLWREGHLRQLNEDHSMAPVIDQMAKNGEITSEEAVNHPDRNALTSVLMGRALKAMDVPKTAIVLDPGDVLIQASDGLQFLDNEQISRVLAQAHRGADSRAIADLLMGALRDLDDPAQDNAALLVLQLTQSGEGRAATMPVSEGVREGAAFVPDTAPPSTRMATGTGSDESRTSGERRWLMPVAALGWAVAVIVGLFFGLPKEWTPGGAVEDTASGTALSTGVTDTGPVQEASSDATQSEATVPLAAAPVAEPAPVLEAVSEAGNPEIPVRDKLGRPLAFQGAGAATLPFVSDTTGSVLGPIPAPTSGVGANAIGTGALNGAVAPLQESLPGPNNVLPSQRVPAAEEASPNNLNRNANFAPKARIPGDLPDE